MARHTWVISLLLTSAVTGASRQPPATASQGPTWTGLAGEQEVEGAATASSAAPVASLFPGLPPLPPLPALPALPPLPPLPALLPPLPPLPPLPSPGTTTTRPRPPSPPPTECLTSLVELLPCVDYLTNDATAPPGACCDGFRSLVGSALICLCHGINGDMSRMISRPIDPVRMVLLPAMCSTMLPPQSLFICYTETVPPLVP
uniref:Bifunctional inhibitor/plant lipid transfer protein/seed storage helical domain-containing protein n=1 Tax=Oryza glumipatula TaxID=40148 RepID=A0A0E0ALY9_9ORYZ